MSVSLAWQSADWLRLLRTPAKTTETSAHSAQTTAQPTEIGQLFGTSSVANDSPAPNTTLRLTLLGSFVHADPQRSSAIIRSEGSSAQRYTINSEISSGVRLHAVAADRVELLRNGRRESLSFPISNSATSSLQSSTSEVAADPLEQLSELESDDLVQLRERMDALRQQMQASGSVPDSPEPTEQPTENN
ncbi:secretion protein XcpP [Pseudomonas anguilliseptica]|nr:secretion protein XcpP [Pseudomonas anguilliseptica]